MLGGIESEELNGEKVRRLEIVLTLGLDFGAMFGDLHAWFEETEILFCLR